MGTPGRKPKPTNLKRLQGNPGKRKLNKGEPTPERGDGPPDRPYGLATRRPTVAKQWDEVAPQLHELGLLTGLDVGALRLMLEHYQVALEALAEMRQQDGTLQLVRTDENGVGRKHPMLQILRDNSTMYLKFAAEFGMTPSSRSRLKVEPQAEQLSLVEQLFQAVDGGGQGG